MNGRTLPIALLALLLGLPGCGQQAGDGLAGNSSANGAVDASENYYFGKYQEVVRILSRPLAQEVHVEQVLVGENENGLLRVGLVLITQSGREARLQAQTLYYDAEMRPLFSGPENDQHWLDLTMQSVGPTDYFSQAINPSARHFRIRLRYAPGQKPFDAAAVQRRREQVRRQVASGNVGPENPAGEMGASNPTSSSASSKR
ncbi:MAG: hypothetical protein AAGK14_01550 [Verrucomicrobiota bacterium]